MPESLSLKIRQMSFICACLIVVCHVGNVPDVLLYVCEIALPFFFAVSGYFLAKHIGEDGWWRRAVMKRIWTLIVPLVLINLIYLVYALPFCVLSNLRHERDLFANFPVWADAWRALGVNFLDYPILGVSWFLRALFLMVVFSPLIAKIACISRFGLGVLCWFCVICVPS